jgi:hypothetical protein
MPAVEYRSFSELDANYKPAGRTHKSTKPTPQAAPLKKTTNSQKLGEIPQFSEKTANGPGAPEGRERDKALVSEAAEIAIPDIHDCAEPRKSEQSTFNVHGAVRFDFLVDDNSVEIAPTGDQYILDASTRIKLLEAVREGQQKVDETLKYRGTLEIHIEEGPKPTVFSGAHIDDLSLDVEWCFPSVIYEPLKAWQFGDVFPTQVWAIFFPAPPAERIVLGSAPSVVQQSSIHKSEAKKKHGDRLWEVFEKVAFMFCFTLPIWGPAILRGATSDNKQNTQEKPAVVTVEEVLNEQQVPASTVETSGSPSNMAEQPK